MVYPVLTPKFTLFQSYHNSYQLMQDVFIFLHPQYDCVGLWSVRGYSLVSRLCEAFLIQSRVSLTKWSAFPLILPKAWVSLLKCLQADLCVADLSIVLLSLQESLQAVQRSILPLSGEIKRHPMHCSEQMCCRNKTPRNKLCALFSEGDKKVEDESNDAFTNNAHQGPTVTHCTSRS
jgi:hypothetical protein